MSITKAQLAGIKEAQLQTQVLIPLFRAMGFRDVHLHQGSNEIGKDIVMWRPGDLGERVNYAVVAKAKNVSGKAAGPSSAAEVRFQIEQAFGTPWLDPTTAEQRWVDRCWVVCSKEIKNEAITAIEGVLRTTNLNKVTRFVDGDELWGLIQQHMPERAVIENLQQLQKILDGLDPNYKVVATTTGEFIVFPQKPGALEDHSLLLPENLVFDDTEEGRAAREGFESWRKKGTPVTVAARNIGHPPIPQVLVPLLGESAENITLVLGARHLPGPLLAKLSMEREDGGCAAMEYLHLEGIGGSEEVTYTNEEQPVPWKFNLTLNFAEQTFSLTYRIQPPLNVNQALAAYRFAQLLADGGTLELEHLPTGLRIIDQPVGPASFPRPSQRWIDALEKLVFIQERAKVLLAITEDDEVTSEVIDLIFSTAEIIESGSITHEGVSDITSRGVEELVRNLIEYFGDGSVHSIALQHEESQTVKIFGAEIELGPVTLTCGQVFLTAEDIESLKRGVKSLKPEASLPIRLTIVDGHPLQAWYPKWMSK